MRVRRVYDSPVWRAVRKEVLARDGHVCQIRLPGCKVRANSVDHIVRPEDGGARYDPANLRAACISCNSAKRNSSLAARARGNGVAARVAVDLPRWVEEWASQRGQSPALLDDLRAGRTAPPSRQW
jgi:5-methylcytosine-specific restriction endonuclease McrA